MTFSPVEFAAAFERLRTHVVATDADDSSLLQLLHFWPKLAPLTKNSAYSSYVAEYLAFFEAALTDDNLRDLSLAELAGLESLGNDIGARELLLRQIRKQTARQCFFVGKLDQGLAACVRITREDAAIEAGDDFAGGLSEFETFHAFALAFSEEWPETRKLLLELAEEWQAEREFVSTDRIYCLFVQNIVVGERTRGKLRALRGSVEERGRSAQNDEITFDNQLRASDDPIVGVAYQALAATRRYLKSTGYSRLGSSYFHTHYAVTDKRAIYTGDSIGVATALLAYAQLLHTEALRHDHLLPGDVACTGGIDEAGTVTPVNGGSLHAKVERAFFSHIKYLALPSENVAAARIHLEALQPHYQARQLILLPIASLSAAVNDHNIIRPEKVCIGRVVANTMAKYSRMTTVQVPMLMVLAYLLLCVIYPRAWPWFDRKVDRIEIAGDRFKSVNRNGYTIWKSPVLEGTLDPAMLSEMTSAMGRRYYCLADVDTNDYEEMFIAPLKLESNGRRAELYSFDGAGNPRWPAPVNLFENTPYPGDSACLGYARSLNYVVHGITIIEVRDHGKCVFTWADASYPAREQMMAFDSEGRKLAGSYLLTGNQHLRPPLQIDEDGDGWNHLLIFGLNKREDRACLVVLDPKRLWGVSPPFDNDLFVQSGVVKGSQLYYVSFPETRLSTGPDLQNIVSQVRFDPNSELPYLVIIAEGLNRVVGSAQLRWEVDGSALPGLWAYLDSNFIPRSYEFTTGSFSMLNSYLSSAGDSVYSDQDSLESALLRDIIVYHGDSIVHHPAAGIFFKNP